MNKKEKKEIIFDSNIWIGIFNQVDTLHRKSEKTFKDYKDVDIIVPEYVVLEVVSKLKQLKLYDLAYGFLHSMRNENRYVFLESSNYYARSSLLFIEQTKNNLSFVDTSLLLLADEYEVITFDKALAREIKKLT